MIEFHCVRTVPELLATNGRYRHLCPSVFAAAFQAAAAGRAEALIVVSSRLMTYRRQQVIEFAALHRLPVVSGWGP